MPFKSKSQQRFMFAAEARGDIPEGTAKRWAKHTPSIKSLPEKVRKTKQKKEAHLKLAFLLGQEKALQEAGVKTAGAESLVGNLLTRSAHLWAPAGLGATFAGPDYRTEGALLGLGLGALGKNWGRSLLRQSKFTPEELLSLKKVEGLKPGTQGYLDFAAANKDLASKYDEYLKHLNTAEWAGRLGGGAAAGMAIPRFMGPRSYYPLPQQMPEQQPQFMSPPLPAVSDISGHYSGILPEGMTY